MNQKVSSGNSSRKIIILHADMTHFIQEFSPSNLVLNKFNVFGNRNKWNISMKKHMNISLTVIVCIKDHLQHTEKSTSKIKEDVANTPAFSALPSVVHVSL
jgi:hypothetical protein